MLKITEINRTKNEATLKLEGRVGGEWIKEVINLCEKMLSEDVGLTLDLADVLFIERPAIPFFRELKSREVVFINCSPFLCEQLKGVLK
jgi:hypothetical protein